MTINNSSAGRNILVTGTHCSGKNYLSRILYYLGINAFIQEPLNPRTPPGVWIGKDRGYYFHCDRHSPSAKRKLLSNRLFRLRGLPLFANSGSVAEYSSAWKQLIHRVWLERSRTRFCIKDPFCLFISDFLRSEHKVSPWIVIREPADYVANAQRTNMGAMFADFGNDKEFQDVMAGDYQSIQRYADAPEHQTDFHQNIAYWLFSASYTLRLAGMWAGESGYAVNLLDTLNTNGAAAIARSLERCGMSVTASQVVEAMRKSESLDSIRELRRLQQDPQVLAKPRSEDRLKPLSEDMVAHVKTVTSSVYAQIQELERTLHA